SEAARQWFAGYRNGAQTARAGGYRERGIVESSHRSVGYVDWEGASSEASPRPGETLGPPLEPSWEPGQDGMTPPPLPTPAYDDSHELPTAP
ncbi:MAG TPA: hypothetical protein PKC18_13325, partial [Lacipirellulaceae bacterium]|nr:hypothetical protein [Lacipirellulaceae bacterium]